MSYMINRHGYVVSKKNIDKKLETKIITELHVSPPENPYTETISYKIYHEDNNNYYVPRYWGLQNIDSNPIIKFPKNRNSDANFILKETTKLKAEQMPIVNTVMKLFFEKDRPMLKEYTNTIINIGTGKGKTVISLFLMWFLNVKTVFVVHNRELKAQVIERANTYLDNVNIGYIQGKKYNVKDCNFVVTTIQTLMKPKIDLNKVLKDFDLVIYDETHHYASAKFSQALLHIPFRYSIALTATFERADNMLYVLNLFLGEIGYKIEGQLDQNVAVRRIVFHTKDTTYFREIQSKPKLVKGKLVKVFNVGKMITNLTLCHERNKMIYAITKELIVNYPERNILLVSHRSEHLYLFKEAFSNFIDPSLIGMVIGKEGQKKLKKEEKKQLTLELSEKRIILGIYQLSTEGLDIKHLNTVIPITPMKRTLQVFGRMFRRDKDEYECIPLAIDIIDNLLPFSRMEVSRLNEFKTTYLNSDKSSLDYYDCNDSTKFKVIHRKSCNLKELLTNNKTSKKEKKDPFESDSDSE